MVFAVQCPNPKCKKYQLVEEKDRNRIVPCLICRTPIKVAQALTPPNGQKPPQAT